MRNAYVLDISYQTDYFAIVEVEHIIGLAHLGQVSERALDYFVVALGKHIIAADEELLPGFELDARSPAIILCALDVRGRLFINLKSADFTSSHFKHSGAGFMRSQSSGLLEFLQQSSISLTRMN